MINIDDGRIVDMIYSRESEEVSKWLKTFPNICVVSRDGSTAYASAINTAHPEAIQVSDRFHLIKGLTDAVRQNITGMIAARIRIETGTEKEDKGYWEKSGYRDADFPERSHNATTERKSKTAQRVRELADQGLKIGAIVIETGHSYPTVKKYMDEKFDTKSKCYGVSLPSKLKPYTKVIDDMLRHRKKFKEIEKAICALGYTGAASTIRMYATRKRRLDQATHDNAVANTEVIERKWLLKLLYNPIEKVKGITEAQLERVLADYPTLGIIYHIVREFKEIVFSKRVADLDVWIEQAKLFGSEEINSFLNGLSRDIEAVKNAITYDYNNGIAEGNINKIKLYKRIMFGRCKFETLRNKTLLLEQRKYAN